MINLNSYNKIIITGATGWLGKRVVLAIRNQIKEISAAKHQQEIICLVPTGEDTKALILDDKIKIVNGDIRDNNSLKSLFENSEGALVIHLAGIIHPKLRTKDFFDINYKASLNLVNIAKENKVKRLVIMSSNSPLGCNPNNTHKFTETDEFNPYMKYGLSKKLMELGLQDFMTQSNTPEITIIRAPWFYGPGQPARQTLFFSMIKNGKFPILGDGTNQRSMAYVDSLALGMLLSAASKKAIGEVYWIADEEPYSMNEIVKTIQEVLSELGIDTKTSIPRLPAIISDCARLADKTLQTCGLYQQKIHVLSEMNQNIACDISKAKAELGYQPILALKQGMHESIKWCLANNLKI
ncbi:MAG: NAD(P)-dependent oxidoreductase [Rickettsiales bacterium]|jgi:nucleoside-diphosphate-sugar epimerase|nr:NAD(P)-dependent oxidoreductase [Rickettsiales bacterium]